MITHQNLNLKAHLWSICYCWWIVAINNPACLYNSLYKLITNFALVMYEFPQLNLLLCPQRFVLIDKRPVPDSLVYRLLGLLVSVILLLNLGIFIFILVVSVSVSVFITLFFFLNLLRLTQPQQLINTTTCIMNSLQWLAQSPSSSSIAVLQLKGWRHVWPFSNCPCLPQILLHRWSEVPSSHWCLPSIVSLVAPTSAPWNAALYDVLL